MLSPYKEGTGFEFVDKITGGAIPKEFIKPVEEGVRASMESGRLAGFPVVDVKVTLTDGKFHEVDSSEMAFRMAGYYGLQEACREGSERFCLSPSWMWK